jgi:hypothetical protein
MSEGKNKERIGTVIGIAQERIAKANVLRPAIEAISSVRTVSRPPAFVLAGFARKKRE